MYKISPFFCVFILFKCAVCNSNPIIVLLHHNVPVGIGLCLDSQQKCPVVSVEWCVTRLSYLSNC